MRLSVLAILAMVAYAAFLKAPAIRNGAPNLEATYHVLLTDTALARSPASEHHFLPTVTLNGPYDKHIPWGATLPLPSGQYVYTSFPITGFLAPYAFFKLTGEEPGRTALFEFALLLHALVVAALSIYLVELLRALGFKSNEAWPAVAVGVIAQTLSYEALMSYGAIYWSQQLYQLFLILSLLCTLKILVHDARDCTFWTMALGFLTFIGVYTEWTGIVFAGGLTLLLLYLGRQHRRYRGLALLVAGTAALSLASIAVHYMVFLGWKDTIHAISHRAAARSAIQGSPLSLAKGYLVSFGLLVPLAMAILAIVARNRHRLTPPIGGIGMAMFAVSIFPLLENIILIQHASEFSFDRMKLAVPVAMILAVGFAHARRRRQKLAIVALVAIASIQNIVVYELRLGRYRQWAAIDRSNQDLARAVAAHVKLGCALLATNAEVRGYLNLLFQRSIIEATSPGDFAKLVRSEQSERCGAVYIEGDDAFTDLPRLTRAFVRSHGNWIALAPSRR